MRVNLQVKPPRIAPDRKGPMPKSSSLSGGMNVPTYQDGCVRVGIVLATVMKDLARAKAINEPLCAGDFARSCAVVAVSDCFLKLSLDGRRLPGNVDPALAKACATRASH